MMSRFVYMTLVYCAHEAFIIETISLDDCILYLVSSLALLILSHYPQSTK